MRALAFSALSVVLLLSLLPPTLATLSLSTFQQVSGFPSACTDAYNTPLAGCSSSDFTFGGSCSTDCIAFLEVRSRVLNAQCTDTSADPNTLIGMFFDGVGPSTLCSNLLGDGIGDRGSYVGTAAASSATSSSTTNSFSSSSTSRSTTLASTTLQAALSSSTATSSSTTTASDSTTTTVVIVGTTIAANSPSSLSISTTSHTIESSTMTSSSSGSTPTGNGDGGGTLLDIGSSACRGVAIRPWLLVMLAGSAGIAWLR